ncbi:MAG: N-acetylmuramoyl-L-alanine amidase, partial [Chitinophagia bacterium]|nr:N-acetylmuramoyl-L-alanine amidase [Chitinophagia bacterium]
MYQPKKIAPMHIENHLLYGANGLQVAYRETPNHSGQFAPDNLKYLIMHYTASVTGAPAINWLVNPAAKASAHLVIDRDGTITQLAPFNRITWHAGESAWGNLKFMNQFSIGIELVNAGLLLRKPNGWTTQNNIALPDSDVVLAQHKNGGDIGGWQQYTEAQLAAAQ